MIFYEKMLRKFIEIILCVGQIFHFVTKQKINKIGIDILIFTTLLEYIESIFIVIYFFPQ